MSHTYVNCSRHSSQGTYGIFFFIVASLSEVGFADADAFQVNVTFKLSLYLTKLSCYEQSALQTALDNSISTGYFNSRLQGECDCPATVATAHVTQVKTVTSKTQVKMLIH